MLRTMGTRTRHELEHLASHVTDLHQAVTSLQTTQRRTLGIDVRSRSTRRSLSDRPRCTQDAACPRLAIRLQGHL
jgi:hypothetical protein